ncbi:replicative DNA helicase [Billgrantia desiderata]|uniref:replicative DNA helicase n=1 Tax=Billgrantia desiderata TaxID=52021 RepID=UPI00089F5133|nr:replicative DNA helicase [Halomonas desiderata]SEG30827.1 primary replicative DNA helicase [Halomonas desiderata]
MLAIEHAQDVGVPFLGNLPPHSIEAECSVLGALMLDNDAWDEVADRVAADNFYHPAHRRIFAAIQDLVATGKPMDVVTVSEHLGDEALGEIGGIAYLAELVRNTPSAANIVAYADVVRDRAQLRGIAQLCNDASRRVYDREARQGRSAVELINEIEQGLFVLGDDRSHELSSIGEILSRTIDIIDHAFNSDDSVTGVPTGFDDLDELTAGWQPSDLIIIAGRPSMGKTAMGLRFVESALFSNATAAAGPVLVFSLEMPEEQLMLRLLASRGRISLQKLRTGKLEDDDWPRLTAAVTLIKEQLDGKLFIDDQAGISASQLKARARRLARRHGRPSMILIDYLQLLHESGGENRNLEVSSISRILKEVAKELRCPVIALSQLNRGVESRPNKRPGMADLRDSGAIEQDADVIGFVYRDEVYHPDNPESKGIAELIIGKQRNGPIGTVHMAFLEEQATFGSLEWRHSGEAWA